MNGFEQTLNGMTIKKGVGTPYLRFFILILACHSSPPAVSAEPREDVLKPYDGPSNPGVDSGTLTGKVMTGYQGWFNCESDGANLGWTHWARDRSKPFGPGNVTVDLWPDVSEYDEDELYTTAFSYEDGTLARTFSSHTRKTVIRHFKWMADYGIDGAFVQRFAHGLQDKNMRDHKDKVLSSAREGANRHGRTYTVMYDLTGIRDEDILQVFDDWRVLRGKMHLTEDPAFQHHNGKPLVAIWGIGFNDRIKPRSSLEACTELIGKFKADGCSVMLGIATGWRAQDKDALNHPDLHQALLMADVLSPWSVGRFRDLAGVGRHAEIYWAPDMVWAREHDIDYMPVVFPGFSRHNLAGSELASIPRLAGQFFLAQIMANKKAGADMLYIAMFDEVDEGTAIFKCSNHPPTSGGVRFLTLDGLPSDAYLRLAGKAGRLLRGEISHIESVAFNGWQP
ncbi:MAG: glycoside hydrolase family 71/99-like protein [Verrucomicrobia bacterium]|nr:glycoside hydrolase family 71/99-like protein [Verrucomicrobiota bacterium]